MIDPFTVAGGISAAASLADKFLKMPTKVLACRYDAHTKLICVKLISSDSDVVLGAESKDFLFACASPWFTSELRSDKATATDITCAIHIRKNDPTEVFFRADPIVQTSQEPRYISIYTGANPRKLEVRVP